VVESVGEGVEALRQGDRVVVHFVIGCGQCPFCARGEDNLCPNWRAIGVHADGGFAQYVLVPAENALPIPEALSPEEVSLIPCGLGTPYRAIKQARVQAAQLQLFPKQADEFDSRIHRLPSLWIRRRKRDGLRPTRSDPG
jgi:D-arabinose 1-dehydrogenase-like Zn-dependent alcohol dehydrogenase